MSKDRGGWGAAGKCVEAALQERGYVRPRDFQQRMNAHNWLQLRNFELKEVAPHIWVQEHRTVATTAIATACVKHAVVGLESALWVMRILQVEPTPVQLVVPRGSRTSNRTIPLMEFHWSDVPDEAERNLAVTGIPLRVHSPARALVDIIRIRPPNCWPSLRDDLAWASSLELFSVPTLLELGSKMRCREKVIAWIAAQQPADAAALGPPEP